MTYMNKCRFMLLNNNVKIFAIKKGNRDILKIKIIICFKVMITIILKWNCSLCGT